MRHQKIRFWSKKSNSGYGQIHKKHINQKESKIFLNCTKL